MNIRTLSRLGMGAFLIATAAVVTAPAGLAAQDADAQADCRCFDRDGNERENCTCFYSPRFEIARGGNFFFERRAQIGVSISYDTSRDSERWGALIDEVAEDGPAWDAGMRPGDIVTHVDGQSVLDPIEENGYEEAIDLDRSVPVQRFVFLVGMLEPEEEVEFRVRRDGDSRTLTVEPEEPDALLSFFGEPGEFIMGYGDGARDGRVLRFPGNFRSIEPRVLEELRLRERGDDVLYERLRGEELRSMMEDMRSRVRVFPEDGDLRLFDGGEWAFGGDPCVIRETTDGGNSFSIAVVGGSSGCMDGVEMIDMNEGLGSYFGTTEGVLITEVRDESTLGLESGDVLLQIDGRTIDDRAEARRVLSSYDLDEELTLRVRRDGREIEVLGRRRASR